MNIIISGGWGYGNLGDDAILLSTLQNVYNNIPNANITILSSNIQETAAVVCQQFDKIQFAESFHSLLFGNVHLTATRIYEKVLLGKIINRVLKTIHNKNSIAIAKYLRQKSDKAIEYINNISDVKDTFQQCDLFIMSGGGYLNDWLTMCVSKYIETLYAKKYDVPIVLVGQTVGPFKQKYTRNCVKDIIALSSQTYFRDKDSYHDFVKDYPHFKDIEPMPDIALSEKIPIAKKKQITVIPFTNTVIKNRRILLQNLIYIQKQTGYTIVITVSQLWADQIAMARFLYHYLLNNGVDVIIKIPQNVVELQKILGQSQLVISENLHGLILAWRSGSRIICLNKKRKFVTFMQQINAEEHLIELSNMESEDCFYKLYQTFNNCDEISKNISNKIKNIFGQIFANYAR